MTKAVTAWAVRYYKKGLGLSTTNLTEDEVLCERKYNELFLEPLKVMTDNNLSADTLNRIITHLNNKSPHQWQYILKYVVDKQLFEITGTFEKDWDKTLNKLNELYTKRVATAYPLAGNDIEVYVDEAGNVIGEYPKTVYIYSACYKAHVNGRYVQDLLRKDLTRISDVDRELIIDLVNLGEITADKVMVDVSIPVADGRFADMTLPITDNRVPPAEVLQLIGNLPSTLIAENNNDAYAALRSYALTANVSEIVNWYLNTVICDHFGTSSPTIISESVDVPQNSDDVTVEYFQGTLDELISSYCTKEGIDTNCTIEQLIRYINYECTIKPATLQEQMAAYKAEHQINGETTFDEFISGSPHQYIDNVGHAIDCIKGNPCIPPKVQDLLVQCILEDVNLELPEADVNFGEVLTKTGLDSGLVSAIVNAIETGSPVDITKCIDVKNAIVSSSNIGPDLKAVLIESLRNDSIIDVKDVFMHKLPALGLPSEIMSRISIAARNNTPYEPEPPKVIQPVPIRESYSELGYNAGEVLLRETRMSINKDASFANRNRLTPVLYSFLRLLMCDMNTEKDDVREFLNTKMKGVDASTAEIIKKALNEIK